MKERTEIMKELMDIDSKQDQTATEDLRQANQDAPGEGVTSPPPEPVRHTQGRHKFLIILAISLGIVAGVIAWQHWATRTKVANSAAQASKAITDLVVLDESQLRQVFIEPVGARTITVDRNATGRVSFNEDRLTPVFSPYAGRVLELLANKGANVRRGQPLVVLESPEVVAAQNDLASARSDLEKARIGLDAARITAERARRLHEQEAVATKDLQQGEADLSRAQDEYRRAQVGLAAVENRLSLFGKDPKEIAGLGERVDRQVVIRAPIAGTIVDRKIGPGQYVKPDAPDPLFLISDLATLWILADVYESDVAMVHLGAPVGVSVPAYPNRVFPAHISFISPTVDPATRTVRVRCLVQNPQGLLKPDMFATIKIGAAAQQSVPVIPASALVTEGDSSLVFVEEGQGRFRRRKIQPGQEMAGSVAIATGLSVGERVATRGGLLMNELIKSQDQTESKDCDRQAN
jgi:membrane fusion protein, heavy metal efflux system